ncbi:Hypothetical protein BN2458_PEG0970 [Helicobacter typhlonius]|uniref:Uncharacterized protein n=1 Tax=Helicobacter typhlonius TaxID=76936 RepID=A0A0S4PU59_9HELI|nr:Hypothetical protein BN2458_PEG0970 [Helicobacter typhlonius]
MSQLEQPLMLLVYNLIMDAKLITPLWQHKPTSPLQFLNLAKTSWDSILF